MTREEIRNQIAHKIAWESTKHYDPMLSKESWCEMAVREAIDRIGGEYLINYMQGYKDAIKDACELLARMVWEITYEDLKGNSTHHCDKIEFIEEFKKAMEEQQ